ncbi:hypothetical protein ZHAS_00021637 [Anopheles sinensis]|uniref:Uncharacterized protein n=1 Tax=Anopheles sinensis TaxID=74873 RepID=A0A084WSY6_ANOSI|nr:hypothetical protein ZHAS_00021637 [Anopheles sinensis]
MIGNHSVCEYVKRRLALASAAYGLLQDREIYFQPSTTTVSITHPLPFPPHPLAVAAGSWMKERIKGCKERHEDEVVRRQ